MRKKNNCQYKFRSQKFKYDQYWSIAYTEVYKDGLEKDFKTVIKAKSYFLAKEFLRGRVNEDDPSIKLKSIAGWMLHANYKKGNGRTLTLRDWEAARASAFPNENNVLFKLECPRDPSKTSRFNTVDKEQLKKIGFKKGHKNWSHLNIKGTSLPKEERSHKIYRGKWIDWDEDLRKVEKDKIIGALLLHNNSRSAAARHLGYGRGKFYDLLSKFPEINWRQEYPPPIHAFAPLTREERSANSKKVMAMRKARGDKIFEGAHTPEAIAKSKASNKIVRQKKLEARLVEVEPQMRKALVAAENVRSKAAESLGMSLSNFYRYMSLLEDRVDWGTEYPSPFSHA